MARRISQSFLVFGLLGLALFAGLFVEYRSEIDVSPLSAYFFSGSEEPPVESEAFIVMDLETQNVLLEKNPDEIYPIASLTKLMTALVATNHFDQFASTTVSWRAVQTEGRAGRLAVGDELLLRELLFPLLLESSNDAAEALAEFGDREEFIEKMNIEASQLNLSSTVYADPSGLSPENVSSARDLAHLAEHIYRTKRHLFDITLLTKYQGLHHTWRNNSRFRDVKGYLGGKNGFIPEARHTLLSLLEVETGPAKRPVVIVLLGTYSKEPDMNAIRTYIEDHISFK